MLQRLTADRYGQFLGMGPIQLHRLSRGMLLGEVNFLLRTVRRAPATDSSLKGSQVILRYPKLGFGEQKLEETFGFQFRCVRQHLRRFGPDLGQGIRACAPGVRLLQLLRSLLTLNIFAGRLSIDSRPKCTERHMFALGVLLAKPPVLLEVNHRSERLKPTGTHPPPGSLRTQAKSPSYRWGILIVISGEK